MARQNDMISPYNAAAMGEGVSPPLSAGEPAVDHSTIGQRIRTARKALDLNQEALALRLGVTQPTVANWEADVHNPRQLMLAKLAQALSVSLGWLAGGEEAPRVPSPLSGSGYLARALLHVPVVPSELLTGRDCLSPSALHAAAVDFIPISARSGAYFAVFLTAHNYADTFPGETLFVFDGLRERPVPGCFVLLARETGPTLMLWNDAAAASLAGDDVLGTLAITVRFF